MEQPPRRAAYKAGRRAGIDVEIGHREPRVEQRPKRMEAVGDKAHSRTLPLVREGPAQQLRAQFDVLAGAERMGLDQTRRVAQPADHDGGFNA